MSENNPDNSTITGMREHITRLETQLSEAKINHNMTASEKQALETKQAQLTQELEAAKATTAELEAVKARAAELENKFVSFVNKEIDTIPAEKREEVKSLLDGLTPEKQLEKLEGIKKLMSIPVNPSPANPHGTPQNPTIPNPVTDAERLRAQEDAKKETFNKFVEATKNGADPLAMINLSGRPGS